MTPADTQREDELDDQMDEFEDDLSDDHQDYADDSEYAEDDWGDDVDDELAADPAQALGEQKKKSKVSNNLIIAAAVVVGVCVLVFQVITQAPQSVSQFQSALGMRGATDGPVFGNKAEEPGTDTTKTASSPTENSQTGDAPANAANSEGFLNSQKNLPGYEEKAQMPEVSDVPPQPAPIAAAEDGTALTPLPSDIAANKPDEAQPVKVEGRVDATSENMVPRGPDDQPDETKTPDQNQSPEPTKAEDILKAAIADRAEKQATEASPQDNETKQDQAPAALDVAAAEPVKKAETDSSSNENPADSKPSATNPPAVDNAKLDELMTRLSQLEAQLAEKDKKIESTTAELEDVKNKLANTSTPVTTAETAPTQKTSPSSKPKNRAVKKNAGSGKWVLRAAQPGRAWISKSGERDMKAVQVGDTVPGLGRITDISYNGQKWAVAGTQGRVNQ